MDNLRITEYRGIRVLTTQQIAEAYETDAKVISNNYNRNKDRYIEGKHFICLEGSELKEFKTNHQFDESSKINKDSLTSTHVLQEDNRKCIPHFYHDVSVDKENPRIEVTITELTQEQAHMKLKDLLKDLETG
ncbi:MAG: ORF6N domain-containing protein [Roseburia sp.]